MIHSKNKICDQYTHHSSRMYIQSYKSTYDSDSELYILSSHYATANTLMVSCFILLLYMYDTANTLMVSCFILLLYMYDILTHIYFYIYTYTQGI